MVAKTTAKNHDKKTIKNFKIVKIVQNNIRNHHQ